MDLVYIECDVIGVYNGIDNMVVDMVGFCDFVLGSLMF